MIELIGFDIRCIPLFARVWSTLDPCLITLSPSYVKILCSVFTQREIINYMYYLKVSFIQLRDALQLYYDIIHYQFEDDQLAFNEKHMLFKQNFVFLSGIVLIITNSIFKTCYL